MAGRTTPWYTVLVSIMATQASAITFLSAPGLAYAEGMGFVQFYFGLPLAMVVLAVIAVPIYHRLQVYTAYEYLEARFDLKTRSLATGLFLLSRGVSTGISIYATSIVLSVLLGWNVALTNLVIGGVVVVYTTSGGSRAVNWTQSWQFLVGDRRPRPRLRRHRPFAAVRRRAPRRPPRGRAGRPAGRGRLEARLLQQIRRNCRQNNAKTWPTN